MFFYEKFAQLGLQDSGSKTKWLNHAKPKTIARNNIIDTKVLLSLQIMT